MSACPSGGAEIESGIDKNGDNQLQNTEITSISYVCSGAQGAPGTQIQVTAEPPGKNCPAGGERIDLTVPGDGGFADPQTSYVCNGQPGSGSGTSADGGTDVGSGGGSGAGGAAGAGGSTAPLQTIFVIVMENHNWSDIKGNASAPYINDVLLPQSAHAEAYFNPPGIHPSLPNYIWMEAGDNLGLIDDNDPASNHQSTTSHLVSQLASKGITWKAYAEDIDGQSCPITPSGNYVPKHVPFVYFDDVTSSTSATSPSCIQHVRPYPELAADLAQGSWASYNFIVPNLCDDMHGGIGSGCPADLIRAGDTWLSTEVPRILASRAYQAGGALFITWDEAESGDGPIGLIAISPKAKPGFSSNLHFDHSSLLKTIETVFGVPFLRAAAFTGTSDLSDLFTSFP